MRERGTVMTRPMTWNKVYLSLGFLLMLAVPFAGAARDGATTLTLHFPEDRAVGRVLVEAPPEGKLSPGDQSFAWSWSLPTLRTMTWSGAQGTVTIPGGRRLGLELYDPSPLDQFASDQFEWLTLQPDYMRAGYASGKVDDAAMVRVARLTGLRSLTLTNTEVTEKGLASLAALRKLEQLTVNSWGRPLGSWGEREYARVGALTTLRGLEINLRRDTLSSATLAALAALPRLERLILWVRDYDPRGLAHFAKNPALRTLVINCTAARPDRTDAARGIGNLAGCPALQYLAVNWLGSADAGQLGSLTGLKGLRTSFGNGTLAAGLQAIAKLKGLEELHLENSLDAPALASLATLPALKILSLNRINNAGGGDTLSQIPSLESLHLQAVDAAALASVAKIPKLRTLTIGQMNCPPEALAGLAALPRLEALSAGYGVDDAKLARIAAIKSLRSFNLWRDDDVPAPGLTAAGFAHLKELPRLESFRSLYVPIGDAEMKVFGAMPHLRRLYTPNAKLTPAGLASLARSRSLEEVSLHGWVLSADDMLPLAALPQLKKLSIIGSPKINRADVGRIRVKIPGFEVRDPSVEKK
jgi:hypothetical protein